MDYYDEISDSYNELHGKEQLQKLKIIKKYINVEKNEKLLDIGCGTGLSSNFGCFVVGIDLSLRLLKKNNKTKVLGTGEDLPFKDHSFDYVISVSSLHHVTDIKKVVNEMKRVGKKRFAFSLFKRSHNFTELKIEICRNFRVTEEIDEKNDLILII